MLRVLFVEDEPLFREGVISSLDWGSLGMEIPNQAFDGLHALSLMEHSSYEYVITDLFMPRMGGLEFLKTATDTYPQTNYIVLSGYNDFELVKEAFQLGVVDYILKSEISQLRMEEIVTRQSVIRKRILSQDSSLSLGAVNTFYIKQSVLRNSGTALDTLGETAIAGLHIPIHPGDGHIYCCAVSLHLTDTGQIHETYQESRQRGCAAIDSIIMEQPSLYGYERRGVYYLLYITKQEMTWLQLDNYWRHIQKVLLSGLPKAIPAVSMGFCSYGVGLGNVESIVKESTHILDFRLLISDGAVISKPKLDMFKSEKSALQLSVNKLATTLASLHKKDIGAILRDSLLTFDEVRCCIPKDVSAYYETIFSLFLSFQEPLRLLENERFRQVMQEYSLLNLLDRNYIEYNRWISKLADVVENSMSCLDSLTEKAVEIITEQYSDTNLSLTSIAHTLKTNPSYLSRKFSTDMGKGISLFLLEYRIEKAVELITQGNWKLYEVASSVGYTNYETFSRAFKRYKGESPQNYV